MGDESAPFYTRFLTILLVSVVLTACTSGSESGSSDELAANTTETPSPDPDPTPDPEPDPTPDPEPDPTPDPEPDPTPDPEPDPTPDPEPDPTPDPGPEPDPEPTPVEPTVQLSANDSSVASGGFVNLTWSSTDADTCNASSGWSGGKTLQGQETVGPLSSNTTFTLNCSGAGGNAMIMVSVDVFGALNISWQAPTEDVDGNPIAALDSYRILYGTAPGNYGDSVLVAGSSTAHSIETSQGSYYVAMTAIDSEGDESAPSNEVLLATQ